MGLRTAAANALAIAVAALAGCTPDSLAPQNPAHIEKSSPPRPRSAPPVERVRDWTNAGAPKPAGPDRNPFTFGDRGARSARSAPLPPGVSAESLPELPLPVPGSDLRLIGIAGGEGPDAQPTAIVTVGNDLVFAKAGDTIAGRYRVVRVSEDSLDVIDTAGNQPRHLSLR
jgi:hypothetical protein